MGLGTRQQDLQVWWRSSCLYQPLAEATVIALARRIQRWQQWPQGAEAAPPGVRHSGLRARDHLVRHNLRLIVHTYRRMLGRGLLAGGCSDADPHCYAGPIGDAFQEAAIQLQRAAERFDPCRGTTFATYATPWLQAAFLAQKRQLRRQQQLHYQLEHQLQQPCLQGAATGPISFNPLPWRQLLATLAPKERQLIRHRYLRAKPLTGRQIATRLGIETQALASMEQGALRQLRESWPSAEGVSIF